MRDIESMLSHRQSQKGNEFYSEYQRWKAMRRRCYYKKDKHFKDYGQRGIKVCKRWKKSFENFLKDMGKCPHGFSLERLNNEKGYSPLNCYWADKFTQAQNKRNVKLLTLNGVTKPAVVWARINGIKRSTFSMRIKYGWDLEKSATYKREVK